MLIEVRARRHDGKWLLSSKAAAPDAVFADKALQRAELLGKRKLEEIYSRLGKSAGVFRFELSKVFLGDGEVALGLAAAFAEDCLSAARDEYSSVMPSAEMSMPLIRNAFAEATGVCGPDSLGVLRRTLTWWCAAALSLPLLLLHALIFGARASTTNIDVDHDLFLAVHAEWSNRTRHVLSALPHSSLRTKVVLLGRPRKARSAVASLFARHMGHNRLDVLRPFSIVAAVKSLPSFLNQLNFGLDLVNCYRWNLTFRDLLGVTYRLALGAAQASWWQSSRLSPKVVVFGQTGLADLSMLESAMQASGTTTIHAFHGITAGINFTGSSDIAVTRCEYDARWHMGLGGYGRCVAYAEAIPTLQPSGSGVLLMSNLAHPMNKRFQQHQLADEKVLLEFVARCARAFNPNCQLRWHPHPVYRSLTKDHQEELDLLARRLGYMGLEHDETFIDAARRAQFVFSSRSTVLIELLAVGVVPILVDLQFSAPSVLDVYPCTINSENTANQVLTKMFVDSERSLFLKHAWQEIGPAAKLSRDQLLSATGGLA